MSDGQDLDWKDQENLNHEHIHGCSCCRCPSGAQELGGSCSKAAGWCENRDGDSGMLHWHVCQYYCPSRRAPKGEEKREGEEGHFCSAPRTSTFLLLLFLTPQLSLLFSSLPCDVSWDNAGINSQFHTWNRQGRQRKQDLPFSTQIIALQSSARFSLLCRVQSTSIPKVHTDLRLFQALAAALLYLLLLFFFSSWGF